MQAVPPVVLAFSYFVEPGGQSRFVGRQFLIRVLALFGLLEFVGCGLQLHQITPGCGSDELVREFSQQRETLLEGCNIG